MDRNSIIGILLIAVILIGYSVLTKPSKEEMAEQQRIADSIRIVQQEAASAAQISTEVNEDSLEAAESEMNQGLGLQRNIEESVEIETREFENEVYTIENNLLKLSLSKYGGKPYSVQLKEYQTHDSLPLMLFEGDKNQFGLEFFSNNQVIRTNDKAFEISEGNTFTVVESSPRTIALRLDVDSSGSYLEYRYTLNPESYMVDFDLRMKGLDQYRTDNVQFKWEVFSPQQEKGRVNEKNYTNLYYKFYEGDIEKFRYRSKKEIRDATETTKIEWVGYKQQFFSNVILSHEKPFEGGYMSSEAVPEGERDLMHFSSVLNVPYDRTADFNMNMKFYFGPNHFQSLKKIGYHLQELVTIGGSIIRLLNAGVIIPIFNWLNRSISNYGIIILLLTLIIKMALLPLTYKSYMSQAKMRALKPEIDEINKKIPKDKAMERQQATMALYKKVGANPMGGCLPMILQMPILYAMFRFFPLSIELRQESFLWATDLSTYDSILDLPFTIPMYGDHVSLFTLLMTVSTILSMRLNSNPTGMDNQMPGMKGMMYFMPVMFMLVLNSFSAGLTYYYFLANLITLGQNYLFKQFVDEEALRKKLHAKKAKPGKGKSKFQQRLEEAAKQRGYKMPKK
jgi:YidC/Oxa1 family membrane protein insertase